MGRVPGASVTCRSMLLSNGALGMDESNSIFEGGIGQRAVELFWFVFLTYITYTRNISKQREQTHLHIRGLRVHIDGCLF